MKKKLKVAVLMGGPSSEHEISLKSGKAVVAHGDKEKYDLAPVVISKKFLWKFPEGMELGEQEALEELKKRNTEIAFIALHGEYGEDGTIQEMLAQAKIPFTGSGVFPSALGMNKAASARLFVSQGLKVPRFITATRALRIPQIMRLIAQHEFAIPFIVKPLNLGSSVGVRLIKAAEDIATHVEEVLKKTHAIIIQDFIQGREVQCGVLEGNPHPRPLPPTEIIPLKSDFFDYNAKYVLGASKEITPPELPLETILKIQHTAARTHELVGCSGISRTDMILGNDGELYVLELNTLPGLTETSLVPQQAKAAGISFPELIDIIIEDGMKRAS